MKEYKCNVITCGINKWEENNISLHLDHINGLPNDHRIENLQYLCPNCHSQTSTFGFTHGKKKYLNMPEISRIRKKPQISKKDLLNLLKNKTCNVKKELGISRHVLINWQRFYGIADNSPINSISKETMEKYASYSNNKIAEILKVSRETIASYKKKYSIAAWQQPSKAPCKEDLENLLSINSATKIGKKFGVSGNAVRKWMKKYKIGVKK